MISQIHNSHFHILLVVEYLKVTSDMLLIRYHMETVLSLKWSE